MVQTVDIEIREQLIEYLEGHVTLAEFQKWFVPVAWKETSSRALGPTKDLISGIELRLAEFTSGHWTETELKEKLADLPYTATLTYGPDGPKIHASSASTPVTTTLAG
jgi:hypothetical protein